MLENYQEHSVAYSSEGIDTEADDNEDENNIDLRKFILTKFNVTKNKDDFIANEDIHNVFLEEEFGDISPKKIAIELKDMGLTNKKLRGKRGWLGMKLIYIEKQEQICNTLISS